MSGSVAESSPYASAHSRYAQLYIEGSGRAYRRLTSESQHARRRAGDDIPPLPRTCRRLKQLEEETGIPDRNWKQVWSRRQRPTAHMIEALARRWPQYAFWLATGLTDPSAGHTAPGKAWTASQRTASSEVNAAAAEFFDASVLTQDVAYGLGDTPEQTEEAKPAPKYKDLDEAIFQLAFQRRLEHLKNQFQGVVDVAGETWKLKQLVAQLDVERVKLALKDSEEFARMFSTQASAKHDEAE